MSVNDQEANEWEEVDLESIHEIKLKKLQGLYDAVRRQEKGVLSIIPDKSLDKLRAQCERYVGIKCRPKTAKIKFSSPIPDRLELDIDAQWYRLKPTGEIPKDISIPGARYMMPSPSKADD